VSQALSQAPDVGPENNVSIRVVRALVRAVEQRGASSAPVLAVLGIAAESLDDAELRLPSTTWYPAIEAALDVTGDPAFGLHWTESITESTFSPLSNLLPQVATFGEALSTLAQFRWLLSDDIRFDVSDDGTHVNIEIGRRKDESPRVERFVNEMIVVGLVRLARAFKPDAGAFEVAFAYPAPSYAEEYARALEQEVRFDAPVSGFRFDRRLLAAAASDRDPELHDTLRSHTEQRLMLLRQRTTYASRVRALLIEHNGPRHISMLDVARRLGLAERTLRRRLAEEGTSYDAVSSAALASIATSYLLDGQRTIQETAFELGFTDRAAFHRAFKRWTGTTPALYRKSRLIS
jgi:AraC-like DNA-binding protein